MRQLAEKTMVSLREVQPQDIDMIKQWRNLPEIARYMYTDHHITRKEHERWFARIATDPSCRYWIITCDSEDVGLANLYAIDTPNSRCRWAFYLASPSVRGKGVGSYVEYAVLKYVFEELRLNKLCCEVLMFNEPVLNMHKSFGFQQEGYFREHVVKDGAPYDVVCLAILSKEWNAMKSQIEERVRAKGLL